jgi:hypothetical protein
MALGEPNFPKYSRQSEDTQVPVFKAVQTAAFNVDNAIQTEVLWDTVIYDSVNGYNIGTGRWTAPLDGIYMAVAKIQFQSGAWVLNDRQNLRAGIDGVVDEFFGRWIYNGTTGSTPIVGGTLDIPLTQGQELSVFVEHNEGGTQSISSINSCIFSIRRVRDLP